MKRSKMVAAALLLLGVVALMYNVRESAQFKNLLAHGRYTICTITHIYHDKNDATYPNYTFTYRNKTYNGYGNSTIQKQNAFFFRRNFKGMRFYVIFLPNNPDQNSILPYCIPPDTLKAPAEGWAALPTGKLTMVVGTADN